MEPSAAAGEDERVGQTPHVGHRTLRSAWARSARGLGGPVLAGALVATGLVGCSSNPAAAVTTIRQASDALIIAADGSERPASDGARLARGDSVRTGVAGSVTLVTEDRTAYLGGSGAYTVRSGVEAVLERGAFVVDARHGPELRLHAGAVDVTVAGAAVRVERSFAVRVGALAGDTEVTQAPAGERTLAVPALHQVVVAGRALPAAATPLVLTDDDAERRVVPDLVADDDVLNSTATSLDRGPGGRAIVRLATAAGLDVRITAASLPRAPAAPLSETALPIVLAEAAARGADAATVADRHAAAVSLRRAGGSWAVVARLIGTDATAAGQAIEAMLAAAGVDVTPELGPLDGSAPDSGAGGSPDPRRTGPGPSPSPPGTTAPQPPDERPDQDPSPSPSPTPGERGPVEETVDDIVDIVEDILPPAGGNEPQAEPNCGVLGTLLGC